MLEGEGGLLEGQGRLVQWYPGHIARAERRLQEQLSQVDAVLEVRDARYAFHVEASWQRFCWQLNACMAPTCTLTRAYTTHALWLLRSLLAVQAQPDAQMLDSKVVMDMQSAVSVRHVSTGI